MLRFVYLLCCVSAAETCLQCDRRIRLLHDNFILSAPSIADQIELKKICDHAYATYKDASLTREGLIGETQLLVKHMLNPGLAQIIFSIWITFITKMCSL